MQNRTNSAQNLTELYPQQIVDSNLQNCKYKTNFNFPMNIDEERWVSVSKITYYIEVEGIPKFSCKGSAASSFTLAKSST